MSDVAPALEQDQPIDAPEAPQTDQPTADQEESFTDSYNPEELPEDARAAYEAAYKRLQGDYTRKTQSISQERQEAERAQQVLQALSNPETAPDVLRALGYELEAEEAEESFAGPEDQIAQLKGEIDQLRQERQQETQTAAEENELIEQIEGLEQQAGREFTDKEIRLLSGRENAPQALHNLLEEIVSERQKAFVESKKAPRAATPGTPASKAADLSTEQGRLAAMQAAAEAALASEQ